MTTYAIAGVVFGFTTQLYANALRKVPLTRYPWEYAAFMTLGGIVGYWMEGACEREEAEIEKLLAKRAELVKGPPPDLEN